MDFTFLWYFLLPVCLLPLLWRFIRHPEPQQMDTKALCVPFFKQLQQNVKTSDFNLTPSKNALLFWLAWLFFVFALMRPVTYQDVFLQPATARQLMLVLDVSGSMAQQDFILNNRRMTRLSAVKTLATDFLNNRKGDAVGLTIFGTEPYVYIPLTQDIKTAQSMLQEVGVGIAGERTAIADALGLALKQMKDIPSDEKVIILLSDGAANAGILSSQEVLDLAKQMNVKIYTVGLGAQEQIIDYGLFTQTINPSADLDEKLLQDIAQQTNAQYFRVKDTKDLKQMYDQLDKLEAIETKSSILRPKTELFWCPLFISMLMFLIGFIIKKRQI